MKRFILIGMLVATPAFAQQPTEYTIKLTPAELDTIGKGLGDVPFKEAAPLLQKLREQIAAQQPKKDENSDKK
jgi:hypothetical protein